MAEETKTGGDAEKQTGSDTENQTAEDTVTREEYESTQRANAALRADNSKFKRELADLKKKLQTSAIGDAENKGDIATFKIEYEKRIKDEKDRAEALETRLRNYALKDKFRLAAKDYIAEDAIEDVWELTNKHFELDDSAGEEKIAMAANAPFSHVGDFLKNYVAKKPLYAKNTRMGGTDGVNKGDGRSKDGANKLPTDEELNSMTREERIKLFGENPELRHRFMGHPSMNR